MFIMYVVIVSDLYIFSFAFTAGRLYVQGKLMTIQLGAYYTTVWVILSLSQYFLSPEHV